MEREERKVTAVEPVCLGDLMVVDMAAEAVDAQARGLRELQVAAQPILQLIFQIQAFSSEENPEITPMLHLANMAAEEEGETITVAPVGLKDLEELAERDREVKEAGRAATIAAQAVALVILAEALF